MNFNTTDRRRHDAAVRHFRKLWLAEHPLCWFCPMPSSEVHEIGTQGNRKPFFAADCSWAAACNDCNFYRLTNYSVWPVVRQLAMKLIYDPTRFDLTAYLTLRGEGPNAITLGEVLLRAEAEKMRPALPWMEAR